MDKTAKSPTVVTRPPGGRPGVVLTAAEVVDMREKDWSALK